MPMKPSIHLEVTPYAGSHLNDVAEEMGALADRLAINVTASFNGVRVLARPGENAMAIPPNYDKAMKAKGEHKHASSEPFVSVPN